MSLFSDYDRVLRWNRCYSAPRSELWHRWTTLDGLGTFFGARQNVEFELGGRFEILFLLDAPEGSQGSEGCTIIRLEPEERLAFTWNAPPHIPLCRSQHTVVEVRFAETGTCGCALELIHHGFGAGAHWDETITYFRRAWGLVLANLEDALNKDG